MQEITDAIVQSFDIRKLKSECNHPNCFREPEKKVMLYEYTLKRGRRVFANLYLCSEHALSVKEILEKIKEIAPQMIIGSDVKEI